MMETNITDNNEISTVMGECDEQLKPVIGRTFDSIPHFEESYKKYAHTVGFSVRSWTATKDKCGEVKYKSFVCSKQGYKAEKEPVTNTTNVNAVIKKRLSTREGCLAMCCVRRIEDGKYTVISFHECHSHELCTPKKRHLLRSNRKLTDPQKNLLSTLDRDLKTLIKDSDAHMFIHTFKVRKEKDPSFYYAYELDNDDQLKNVFWADGSSRYNFTLFGDLLSFDITYRTNKYSMIFAPFTGISNHRLSITFGAALLANEKVETFIWLFDKFIDCMGGNQPTLIVTDQDPAITSAIQNSFKLAKHRFCMRHILKKLPVKVGSNLNSDSTFQGRFNSCVWSSETSYEFENEWISIMQDYELFNNDWLTHMFDIREMWIPSYFKDVSLSGLLRTTCESENSCFNNFVNHKLGLVEFYSRFESAMDVQRQKELKENHDTINGKPNLKTNISLEIHARDIYTRKNFYIFQEELWVSSMSCGVKSLKENNEGANTFLFTVYDSSKPNEKCRDVKYNFSSTTCSCKMFECEGIPCRHIICVWKGQAVNEIPTYCISRRWTKLATSQPIFQLDENILFEINAKERRNKLISSVWTQLSHCIEIAKGSDEALISLINVCSNWEKKQFGIIENDETSSTLYSYYESQKPAEIEIHPPTIAKTKESGKQLKEGKELALELRKKTPRLCKTCGRHGLHDSRNCSKKYTN